MEFPDFMFKKKKKIWMMLVGEFSNRPSRFWKLPQKAVREESHAGTTYTQFQTYTGSDGFGLGNLTQKNGPLVRLVRYSVCFAKINDFLGIFHDVI